MGVAANASELFCMAHLARIFDCTGCLQHNPTYFILCLETDKGKKKRLEEAFLYEPP